MAYTLDTHEAVQKLTGAGMQEAHAGSHRRRDFSGRLGTRDQDGPGTLRRPDADCSGRHRGCPVRRSAPVLNARGRGRPQHSRSDRRSSRARSIPVVPSRDAMAPAGSPLPRRSGSVSRRLPIPHGDPGVPGPRPHGTLRARPRAVRGGASHGTRGPDGRIPGSGLQERPPEACPDRRTPDPTLEAVPDRRTRGGRGPPVRRRPAMRDPIHPGETLREELDALGMGAAELARRIEVPADHVRGILDGQRAISREMALRLGRFLGTTGGVLAQPPEALRVTARGADAGRGARPRPGPRSGVTDRHRPISRETAPWQYASLPARHRDRRS